MTQTPQKAALKKKRWWSPSHPLQSRPSSPPLHPHLVHDFSEPPPSSCPQSWHKISGVLPRLLSRPPSVFPNRDPVRLPSHRRGSLAADCSMRHGSVSPCVSECDSLMRPAHSSSLVLLSVFSSGWRRVILASVLDSHTEGRDSRSPLSSSSSSTRSLCKLAPRLPSLSVSTSLLSFHLPSPSCCSRAESERANEREERGGRRAEIGCRGDHVTEGPSTSCPAHTSLKTSVAIDNSCRATHQPQDPQTQSHWLAGFMAPASCCGGSMLGRVVQSVAEGGRCV